MNVANLNVLPLSLWFEPFIYVSFVIVIFFEVLTLLALVCYFQCDIVLFHFLNIFHYQLFSCVVLPTTFTKHFHNNRNSNDNDDNNSSNNNEIYFI